MTYAQKLKKRENRRKKRQLKYQLLVQSKCNKNETTISGRIELDRNFMDYALDRTEVRYSDTKGEFCSQKISADRQVLIKEVMNLREELNPRKEMR